MRFPSARQIGRVFTSVVACALAAASMPALAQSTGPVEPGMEERAKLYPVADSYQLLPGETLSIVAPGVLANDHVVTQVDQAAVSVVSGPAHGALILNADGGFDYTPAKGYAGIDGFRYRVQAGNRIGEADVALIVFAPSNVALTVASSAEFVEIGSPVTFTFSIENRGSVPAHGITLELTPPPAATSPELRQSPPPADGRCNIGRDGKLRCALGTLDAGGTLSLPYTYVPVSGGAVDVTGFMTTSDPDANSLDDAATGHATAGRLSVLPGHVVVRTPWTGDAGVAVVNASLDLVNEWPMGVGYEVGISDPNLRDVAPGWISVGSPTGILRPFSSESLGLRLSPSGAPGLRRAVLHVNNDSPFAMSEVSVSFTVAFRDVAPERGDDAHIHALAGAGVTSGCGEGIFCPDQPLTRSAAAVWLLRGHDGIGYLPAPAQGIFQDVSPDRRDAAYIEELARRGVAGGCDADNYCPEAPLTRADAAVMVMRMLQGVRFRPQCSPEPMFKDLTDDPRRAWVEEAARRGFFAACDPDGALFCPDDAITRGDAAVVIVNAFKLPLF